MTNALSMVAGALLMGSGVWLGQATQPRSETVVSAQRFVLTDANGAELGSWGVGADGIVELRVGAAGARHLLLKAAPETAKHGGFASLDLLEANGSPLLSLESYGDSHHGTCASVLLYDGNDESPLVSLRTVETFGTGPSLSFWSGHDRILSTGLGMEGNDPYLHLLSPEAGTNKYSSFRLSGTPKDGMRAVMHGAEGGFVKLSSFKGTAELSIEDVEKVRRATLP